MEKPVLKSEINAKINGVATVENNISEAKEYALAMKKYYSNLVFNDKQIEEAKKERASVNKIAKSIADYRKDIIAEFKKPIIEFENTAKETERILKEASSLIDVQVKKYEEEEKNNKKQGCIKIYNNAIGELKELISFEKVFNEKWLNKGTKLSEVEKDIKDIIDKVNSGIEAIKALKSEYETELINTFLDDYDITKAIVKNGQLKEQKEALAKAQSEQEEAKAKQVKEMITKPIETTEKEPIKKYDLRISATYTKLVELKKFMDINKINYERI